MTRKFGDDLVMDFFFLEVMEFSLHPSHVILSVDHDAFCKNRRGSLRYYKYLIKNYHTDETPIFRLREGGGHWRTSGIERVMRRSCESTC